MLVECDAGKWRKHQFGKQMDHRSGKGNLVSRHRIHGNRNSEVARPVRILSMASFGYPIIAALLMAFYGLSNRYFDPVLGRNFVFSQSFISLEYEYVSTRWSWIGARKEIFVLFEYLFIGFVAIAFINLTVNLICIRSFDPSFIHLLARDCDGVEGISKQRRLSLLITPVLFGFNVFLLTNIHAQMRVDFLQKWIQRSPLNYVTMQMFILSESIFFLVFLGTLLFWIFARRYFYYWNVTADKSENN